MELSSVMTLMSFIIFRDSFGLENPFNGLMKETMERWESFNSKTMIIRSSYSY